MESETIQVLLVDDDAGLRDLLRKFFQQRGIEFSVLHNATNIANRLALERPSIVVLDVMMPGVDGLTALRQLRDAGDTIPVIMLTSLAEDMDRVVGLEFGADDYLGKPFTPLELLARIRAVLRRHSGQPAPAVNGRQGIYRFGRFRLDVAARALFCDDKRIKLTGTNYALLEVLVTHPMETLSRAKLLDMLYGPDADITERGMDLAVWRLRRLLEEDPSQPCVIQTVRGVGYMLLRVTAATEMKNPFNTIFGRAALMTTSLLVLAYAAMVFMLGREANQMHAEHASRGIQVVEEARRDGLEATKHIASALGATYLDGGDASSGDGPPSRRETHGLYENALRENLPPGSQVVLSGDTGTVWVRYAGDANWIRIPDATLTEARLHTALALMLALAIAVAFLGAWQAQRPLRRLANAAREFRIGVSTPVVSVSGPREVVELIVSFNEMIREISEYEQERAMMLAGVAHDLRTPLTRMQVRADLLPHSAERMGFLGDVESLGRIVTQFLDFVRDRADGSPLVSVDSFCQSQYGNVPQDGDTESSLVTLDLRTAGHFRLPLVDLDRILANLLENAMTYGEPPVEIATSVQHGKCVLTLRDHGPGIPEDQLEHALQPFVRLDEARGGDAHCGLGLSIVRRLVRRNGGTFCLVNAADGGLLVTLTFPDRA